MLAAELDAVHALGTEQLPDDLFARAHHCGEGRALARFGAGAFTHLSSPTLCAGPLPLPPLTRAERTQ